MRLLNGDQRIFFVSDLFFFQKDDNYNNGTTDSTDRRKKASEAGLHGKLKGIQEVSWQQAVCFVRSAVSTFSWAFCGKLQKPWDILIAVPGQVFACDPLFADARRDLHVACSHDYFMWRTHYQECTNISTTYKVGPYQLCVRSISIYRGEKNPHIPIYFRPFIGVIYNSMYNDRFGAHFVWSLLESNSPVFLAEVFESWFQHNWGTE